MNRFLIILLVVAAIVAVVLWYTGYDIVGTLTDKQEIKDMLPPKSWMANIAAGVISGLIVAIITSAFARR